MPVMDPSVVVVTDVLTLQTCSAPLLACWPAQVIQIRASVKELGLDKIVPVFAVDNFQGGEMPVLCGSGGQWLGR